MYMDDGISKQLRELDDFLLSQTVDDESMLLSEFDGFLAGIAVCPELIPPSEWLPVVWGGGDPLFDDEEQMQFIVKAIMDHYNDVVGSLARGNYCPIYDVDEDDSCLWETWILGFGKALFLRPQAWDAFEALDNESVDQAFFVLTRLLDLDQQPFGFEAFDADAALEEIAPDAIVWAVDQLHRARLQHTCARPSGANGRQNKVGRNDPCPCGSGKKFKRCCLGNGPDADTFWMN